MSGEIFANTAPKYWARGIPVIPLRPMDKRPMVDKWSQYADKLPTQEEQELWLKICKTGNIGLALGPKSGIAIIDYDYDNPEVEAALLKALPRSPWKRVGQKGFALAYRYNNTPLFHIHDETGKTIVDVLSTGSQVVLPPSIHPKTMLPYITEGNVELLDVYSQLPMMPSNLEELLRNALSQVVKLKEKGSKSRGVKFTEFVPNGARDVEMTRRAGFLAFSVQRGELSLKDAMGHLMVWHDGFVQKVSGDPLDLNKGYQKIVEFLIADVGRGRMLPAGWDRDLTEDEKTRWGLNFDEENEEWNYTRTVDYIKAMQNNYLPDSTEMIQCQSRICTRLARSKNLNAIEQERILEVLKGASKGGVAMFKKMIKSVQKTKGIEGISHAEIANEVVRDFQEFQGGPMAFHEGQFWNWNGSNWEILPEHTLRAFVATRFGDFDIAKKFNDYKQVVSCIKDLAPQSIQTGYQVEGINFNNGFLDRDLKLVAHSHEQGMTYTLPFGYHPERADKCPKFLTYLQDSWGKDPDFEEKCQMLREAICVTLFGVATSYQRCFLLWGVPGTGKSVLMKIIMQMVPEEAYTALTPYQWDPNIHKFMISQLSGKLLNVAGELDDKRKINSQIFKQVVTGEQVTSEHKRGTPFKFTPKAAHWFASNYLPKTDDATNAFTRRWLIFSFNHVIPPERKILNLEDEIINEEVEGVVAWALQEWPRMLYKNEYTIAPSCARTLHQMALGNSVVRGFIEDRVQVGGKKTVVGFDDAYNAYWLYASKKFVPIKKPQEFAMEFNLILNEMGYSDFVYNGSKTVYSGMSLLGEKSR